MTISDVIQGIATALFMQFGSGYKIYTEQVEQSLVEPCFFVKCLDPALNRNVGIRFWKMHQFSVQYFPVVQMSYSECQAVFDQLLECMVDLPVGTNILHGTNLIGQLIDGILTFTVNYNLFVFHQETPETPMTDVGVEVDAKEG